MKPYRCKECGAPIPEPEGFCCPGCREASEEEMTDLSVVCAAIRGDDGNVYSLPKPARHHDVIRHMRKSGYEGLVSGERQGFLLSDGSFARRRRALFIAQHAEQLTQKPIAPAHGLFSEDVW